MAGKGKAPPDLEAQPLRRASLPAGPTFSPRLYPIHDPWSPEALAAADARARTRTCKAIVIGILLYLLAGLLTGVGVFGQAHARWRKGRFQLGGEWPGRPDPAPRDGKALSCGAFVPTPSTPGESSQVSDSASPIHVGRNSTRADFSVRLGEQDGFFLSALGSLARGTVTFEIADPGADVVSGRTIDVAVSARYNDDRLIALANVCVMRRKSAHGVFERGLGIYTPTADLPAAASHITFDVVVRVPSTMTWLSSLWVHGPEMALRGSLPTPHIRQVQLSTEDAPVLIEQVHADDARIWATNGAIDGYYNVTKHLSLVTSNGAILASVEPSPLHIEDPISVTARTMNGAIRLRYVRQKFGTQLRSEVETTNGAAYIWMTPAYEGSFDISTTWGAAVQGGPDTLSDPEAGDRLVVISKAESGLGHHHIAGNITWSKQQVKYSGNSSVTTTTGSATLNFE